MHSLTTTLNVYCNVCCVDVKGKMKLSFRLFVLADSDFLTESFRFSFPEKWQVCLDAIPTRCELE